TSLGRSGGTALPTMCRPDPPTPHRSAGLRPPIGEIRPHRARSTDPVDHDPSTWTSTGPGTPRSRWPGERSFDPSLHDTPDRPAVPNKRSIVTHLLQMYISIEYRNSMDWVWLRRLIHQRSRMA